MDPSLKDLVIKLARLALCPAAAEGEWQTAAIKLFSALRKEKITVQELLASGDSRERENHSGPENHSRSSENRSENRRYYSGAASSVRMPFGKYRGRRITRIARIDPGYLNWCLTNLKDLDPSLRSEIERHLNFSHARPAN